MLYLTILLGAKGFVVISYFLQYTPSVQKESHSSFVLSQTILSLTKFIPKKIPIVRLPNTSIIRFAMEHIFIVVINVDNLLDKFGQT